MYRPLPLPLLPAPMEAARRRRRVWVQNKFYPEGHKVVENFWSLKELELILSKLLGCGFQVVYNHPALSDMADVTPDANDLGGQRGRGFDLGDLELIRKRCDQTKSTAGGEAQ